MRHEHTPDLPRHRFHLCAPWLCLVEVWNVGADRVRHQRQQLILVADVVVKRCGLDTESFGQSSHGEPVEALLVQHLKSPSHDPIARQLRTSAFRLLPPGETTETTLLTLFHANHS